MRGGTQLTTLLPVRDGAVLPVLHLNAYKIANPTILARIDEKDFIKLFEGYGYYPYIISGDEPMQGYQQMAAMFDCIILLFY